MPPRNPKINLAFRIATCTHDAPWGGRPLLKGKVQCRFEPSCSEYSLQAVEIHGIRRGLVLTYCRLLSCTHDVPLGVHDPVPPADDDE
ncbi:MAG: membrane protein insertion efficiency factor YidD [Gemmataceae bacterium]|nr:membrane protein insertion efficiency factor YidD [Gemmataceae bacterium]